MSKPQDISAPQAPVDTASPVLSAARTSSSQRAEEANPGARHTSPGAFKSRIAVSGTFEAAHWIEMFPEGHPNRGMHGHSYVFELVAEGPLDEYGMVKNAELLRVVAKAMAKLLDHQILNDVNGLAQPTDECLAAFLLKRARVWERGEIFVRCRVSRPTVGQWAEAEV